MYPISAPLSKQTTKNGNLFTILYENNSYFDLIAATPSSFR
ncbi:hypothetical protein HMPREF9371_1869 [Neisseria shayeganii 871]|uniref:Uncharacterized protein n=1 Tax=Neisseria shayeganii 871 TaxID=1032488 RepID=G4CJS9_9NEIS|nr:hypothetical protein HMPREF9371_1869 [Neisseria shayeganii 871]